MTEFQGQATKIIYVRHKTPTTEITNQLLAGNRRTMSDFSGYDFSGKCFQSVDMNRINLHETNFSGADLSLVNLRGADLSSVSLENANLKRADLRGADLRSANLRGANLHGADLRGANLVNADLMGAYVTKSDVTGAHFIDKQWFKIARIAALSIIVYKVSIAIVCLIWGN